jgi:Zn-dependent protease with chaperone function
VTGLHLLLFAAGLATVAPRWLAAGWVARAPRLGIAAWYAVVAAAGAAASAGLVLVAVGWPGTWESTCAVWAWCVDALRGGHGAVGRAVAGVVLLAVAGVAARLAWSTTRMLRELWRQRDRHAEALVLLGRVDPALGATVVVHPAPAAWLVPGHRGQVVVTSAAVAQLSGEQLAGVLAHERAHARGRHHVLLAPVAALAVAFPRVTLFGHARAEVARLVELCADDAAGTGAGRVELARALVRLAEAATPAPTPTSAAVMPVLAATGGHALERVHRLLHPPVPLPLPARAAIGAGLVGLSLVPMVWVAAVHAVPALAACLPMAA